MQTGPGNLEYGTKVPTASVNRNRGRGAKEARQEQGNQLKSTQRLGLGLQIEVRPGPCRVSAVRGW